MMRVALVHDWLTGMRGGERVIEVLCELYPDATLFTLVHTRGSVSPTIERLRIRRSIVQRLPWAGRLYRHYLPVFPTAVELMDLDEFDLVISSSHCAAKSVVVPATALHLCYCHTPVRYAWDQFESYFGPGRLGPALSRAARHWLRELARWDASTAGRVDRYVSNSRHVASRIRRYYNREAVVVYPPVDTDFYRPDGRVPESYFLVVSALVPYKRIDVAIEAARLAGVPLRIVGQGPERGKLERLAGGSAEFLGTLTDEEVRDLYRGAIATVLPGEEDFGIVPVESMACGRPVVALGQGGALETVRHGETGVLVSEPSAGALAEGLRQAQAQALDPRAIRADAERFGRGRFAAEIKAVIDETLQAGGDTRW